VRTSAVWLTRACSAPTATSAARRWWGIPWGAGSSCKAIYYCSAECSVSREVQGLQRVGSGDPSRWAAWGWAAGREMSSTGGRAGRQAGGPTIRCLDESMRCGWLPWLCANGFRHSMLASTCSYHRRPATSAAKPTCTHTLLPHPLLTVQREHWRASHRRVCQPPPVPAN